MKYIFIIIFVLFVVGCDDFTIINPKPNYRSSYTPSYNNSYNNENVTNSTNSTKQDLQIAQENLTKYYVYPNTLIINKFNSTFVIDAGDYEALSRIRNNNLNPEGMLISLDNQKKISRAKYFILGTKPDIVYDNGMDTKERREYSKYFRYEDNLDINLEVIKYDKEIKLEDFTVNLYTPYFEYGFDPINRDYNSIVAQSGEFLYMSNCYGKCEEYIHTTSKYVVLANNGNCPTNSVEFLLDVDAQTIYGQDYCQGMLDDADLENITDLRYLGINFVTLNNEKVIYDE